jgi:hypothetical protein
LPATLVAACGGSSKTTDTTTTKQKSAPSAQSAHYHVGEHCQKSLAFAYSSQGFTCVNGKLQKKSHTAPPTVHHHGNTTSTAAPQGY